MSTFSVTAIIVTYNRRELLINCLSAMRNQTILPTKILIVDNASSDDTIEVASNWIANNLPNASLISLPINVGGAGGFFTGMQKAFEHHADWVWMMDDDAEPHTTALEELMRNATDSDCIYGSIAVSGDKTSWPLYGNGGKQYSKIEALPDIFPVVSLPFLGFLVSAKTVMRMGYPDAGYFIAGDDHEYCLRALGHGIRIFACGKSFISHPASRHYRFGLGPFQPNCFYIQPWKRYYDVRNRIASAYRHDGLISAYVKTIPATMVRWFATLLHEPDRLAQTKAYSAGLYDGILRRNGRRHDRWGF